MATDASSGSFDLPSVAMLLRAALKMTDFYFLGFFEKLSHCSQAIISSGFGAQRQQK